MNPESHPHDRVDAQRQTDTVDDEEEQRMRRDGASDARARN